MMMKKYMLAAAALLMAFSGGALAHVHTEVGVYVGPYWGPWYAPPPYYYPPQPQVVVVPQAPPPTYIENRQAPAETAQQYWYYCRSAKGYYPYVKECPDGWQKVLPQPEK